ncbi:MAG: TetR/AcrR family transcriptional regulator [Myxococcota bacterium]|nr:TetR family transcriptional regulator [Myxococcales bacterium]
MSQDTRERILEAATRLFADSDSGGASLRAIARAADVNPALLHYHFGGREALFEAAVRRALEPVQARRAAMMEGLRAAPSPASARDLARLFVIPLLAVEGDDPEGHAACIRLLARVFAEQRALAQDLTLKHFGAVMYAFGDLLGEALPSLPAPTRFRRMRLCAQSALDALAGAAVAGTDLLDAGADDPRITELIDFLSGGLQAQDTTSRRASPPR